VINGNAALGFTHTTCFPIGLCLGFFFIRMSLHICHCFPPQADLLVVLVLVVVAATDTEKDQNNITNGTPAMNATLDLFADTMTVKFGYGYGFKRDMASSETSGPTTNVFVTEADTVAGSISTSLPSISPVGGNCAGPLDLCPTNTTWAEHAVTSYLTLTEYITIAVNLTTLSVSPTVLPKTTDGRNLSTWSMKATWSDTVTTPSKSSLVKFSATDLRGSTKCDIDSAMVVKSTAVESSSLLIPSKGLVTLTTATVTKQQGPSPGVPTYCKGETDIYYLCTPSNARLSYSASASFPRFNRPNVRTILTTIAIVIALGMG
jgi:hypothetical protein